MSELEAQIASCMLLGLKGRHMLVPRTMVAEVVRLSFINFSRDEIRGVDSFEWRGCQVPHLQSNVIGIEGSDDFDDEARVVIFYGLKDTQQMPFYGITVNRSPQLLQVSDEDLEEIETDSLPPAELMQVRIKEVEAFIPKVDMIENSLLKLLN